MILQQLKVVVWKNSVIRKRHWFLTIVESVLPILLFLLIAYGRSKITGLNKVEITEVTYNSPQPILYSDLDVSETKLYFTPNTEFYQDIMKRVQVKFQMYSNNVKGFPSSDSLLHYYASHHNNTVIAIIFDDADQKNLNYIMRIHQDYYSTDINTAELYKRSFNFEPGTGSPYYYKGYLSIQKALDMSFIEKLYDKELESNVTLMVQEFPYPPHKQDSALSTMFLNYLPAITLFSFIFISPAVLKRVVEEKYLGTKELLKMVGMKSWMLWLGWFIYGMIPMLLSVMFIVVLMKVPLFGTEYPPIEHTNFLILFVFLVLYCMAATIFCFSISSLFKKPTIAMVAGILIWILSYFVPKYGLGLEAMGTKLPWQLNMLLNIFPNMALHYGYLAISAYEQRDLGVQWNNFYKSSSGGMDDVTMLNVFVMLIIDMIIYMALTLYLDGVNPGKYGVRKPLLFPVYSLVKLIKRPRVEVQQGTEPLYLRHVEEGRGLSKGIEIEGLVKRYGHKLAVNNLNLNIYENQINVLLGHNGAGKSTTMSIITGMLNMTSGSIRINGKDIKNDMDEIRKSLGLCPQHNLLFTDLTVGEHLLFFAKLKGKTSKEAEDEMVDLLKKLHLSDKKNVMACTLSGGMKRKLCLGMAVIGGSKVLVLDEPTSGMDPESRRELWNLLLAWRGEKTILITTHFMEEADVLGDWIAIMANGELKCHGSPLFLKKQFGTGYHLSLIVKDDATIEKRKQIMDFTETYVPKAECKSCNGNNMVFLLPLNSNTEIVHLLTALDDKKEYLKIENLSVTITTLEDVFLKTKMEDDKDGQNIPALESEGETSNISDAKKLLSMRIYALIKKKLVFCWKKLWTYIVPALIAILFFVLTIYLSGNVVGNYGDNGPKVKLQLDTYKHTTAFYSGTKYNDLIGRLKSVYQSLVEANKGRAVNAEDVQKEIVNEGIENIVYYKEHIIASVEFSSDKGIQAIALYNAIAVHAAPISLNLITNSLAKVYLGENYSVTANYWPLETIDAYTSQEFSKDKVRLLWSVLIPIGFLLLVGSFMIFPHIELSTNFTQLQYMCGVKPFWYWSINYVIDFVLFLIISLVIAVISVMMAPYMGGTEFLFLLFILVMYGLGNIPFMYLFCRKKSVSAGFAAFVITSLFFGIILTISVQGLTELEDNYYSSLGHTLKIIFILGLPQVGLAHSVMILSGKTVENYNWGVMPKIKRIGICMQESNPCCDGATAECAAYQSYFPLLKENILLMLVSCIIYIIINILLDWYPFKRLYSKILNTSFKKQYKSLDEADNKDTLNNEVNHTLKAENLCKMYSGKEIVRNIGFTLKKKECLGILGVNGAGKTTTFRMLTRDEVLSRGNVEIINSENKSISINEDEYLENLGYCPQIDALNFILTGREILTLISQLRGVNNPEIVENFLELFELKKDADKPCGHYSGGNKRKLSLAVALIGFPKFVLLDEPTTGVDPSSRRKFWNLISHFKDKKDLSFILTSHSMVECEALCNSLRIMKNGIFERTGTISELKKEQGGFNVKLKLRNKDCQKASLCKQISVESSNSSEGYDEVDEIIEEDPSVTFSDVKQLKEYFLENKGEIKDEHPGLLHIYVDDKNRGWSTIFKEVENIKRHNPALIEDYSISEASLEDIFLTVARSDTKEEQQKSKKKQNV